VIKELWHDPVWSKVIAAGIIGGIGLLFTWIFNDDIKTKWPQIGMIVSGAAFIFFVASYFWGDLNSKPDSPKVEAPGPAQTMRQPTLEATDRSKIDASGAKFTGDLGFPFARADSDSLIDMPNITVTTNKETGITTVTPGNASRVFPPPTGEFSNLSSVELTKRVRIFASELRTFQAEFDKDFFEPNREWPADEKAKTVIRKYSARYEARFSKEALSIAAESLNRIASVESSSMSGQAQMGSTVVFHGKLVGPNPAVSAAAFLEALSSKLASN
jgi:hypothetical protein